jgi:tRNA(Ile)-lysidine synthase
LSRGPGGGLPPREFARAVRDFCSSHELLARGDGVVAAVSGGPDSVALLLALKEMSPALNLRIHVAHLDHGLRRGSASDAGFVRRLAAQNGLRASVDGVDVSALARRRRCSLEEAGREARYAFLGRTARKLGFNRVATGHNRDDQAETVLMRLLRGSASAGLAGIPPSRVLSGGRRPVTVVRPLLARSRAEIEGFLRLRGARVLRDPSNTDQAFHRNRIRHELLPLLERRYNPAVRAALGRAAQALGEDDEFLESLAMAAFRVGVRRAGAGIRMDAGRLARLALPVRRRVLRQAAAATGADQARLTSAHLDALVALSLRGAVEGAQVHLPGAVASRRGRAVIMGKSRR